MSEEGYYPELPSGYIEAYERSPEFDPDSVEEIWWCLQNLQGKSPLGTERMRKDPAVFQKLMKERKESNAEFKAKILKAFSEDDKVYLKKLFKALNSRGWPISKMDGVQAAIIAFDELFLFEELVSREDWPSKQEIRRHAEKILTIRKVPLPTERQWARIYKQAGLKDLLRVTQGRARKRKSNSGTK
jgi:hypothetical protein